MIRRLVLLFVLSASVAFAADAPPSDASLKELLQVTDARKLLDGVLPQIDGMMKMSMQQGLNGRQITPDEQAALDKMREKILETTRQELAWDNIEPLYMGIYRKSFTQDEVDGLIAFYKSPAGAALVRKMPLVIRETMQAMQQRMGPLMQKLQASAQEAVAEINAKHNSATPAPEQK